MEQVTQPGQAQAGLAPVQAGFFGKLPSRGDFLRAGLPRSFVQPWDDWLQTAIAGSRAALGETWVDAWMEAPIWRFCLPAGQCGPDPVLGVWMPSIDRAGRHFPLTLALLRPGRTLADILAISQWIASAETAGLDALEQDLPPDSLAGRLTDAAEGAGPALPDMPDMAPLADGRAVWWTDGAPLVAACVRLMAALPDTDGFAAMLRDPAPPPPPDAGAPDEAAEDAQRGGVPPP